MTPAEHEAQRDAVRLSLLREDVRADRRDMPKRKPPVVVTTPARVFFVPVVTENTLPL
jgi:hypothetical protein